MDKDDRDARCNHQTRMRLLAGIALNIVVALLSDAAAAGPWIRVTNDPAVSSDADVCGYQGQGDLSVVWLDQRTGGGDVYFTRVSSAGARRLAQDVRVSSLAQAAYHPACGVDASGNTHIVWEENYGLYYAELGPSGEVLVAPLLKDTTVTLGTVYPRISVTADGTGHIVYAKAFANRVVNYLRASSAGATLCSQTLENSTDGTNTTEYPNVLNPTSSGGNAAVSWHGAQFLGSQYLRRAYPPCTGSVSVSNLTNNLNVGHSALWRGGNTLVFEGQQSGVWHVLSFQNTNSYTRIDQGAGPASNPGLAGLNDLGQLVVWQDGRSGTSEIYARTLNGSTNLPTGTEWQISPAGANSRRPAIAQAGPGYYAVVWDDTADGGQPEIYVRFVGQGATELCNGADDNQDGTIDEGCDDDRDGYCDANMITIGTPPVCPHGGGDCNDTDATVYPGAPEICDGIDNQCPGDVGYGLNDEGCGERPIARFSYNPTSPGVGVAVAFQDASQGTALTWSWDFNGDGIADATTQNPAWAFSGPGPHSVTLTVTNPYGSSVATHGVQVGGGGGPQPVVTGVQRQYTGVFLNGASVSNLFTQTVAWNGSPGNIWYSINKKPSMIGQGTTQAFNTATDFSPSWYASTIDLMPVNGEGISGPVWTEYVYKFPFPAWLEEALQHGGQLVSLASDQEVTSRISISCPPSPWTGKIPIPEWVPYLGGNDFGLKETQASLYAEVSSLGFGRLQVKGTTGFTAMGDSLDGEGKGSGKVSLLPPHGLQLTEGELTFGLSGTLEKEIGVVEAIPALTSLSSLPVVSWFNKRARLKGELSPSFEATLNFFQDDGTSLRFHDVTGDIGLELKGTLIVDVLPKRVKASAWVAGSGTATYGLPEPFVRQIEAHAEAGVEYEIDAIFVTFSGQARYRFACEWVSGSDPNCREVDAGPDFAASHPVSLVKIDYAKFGEYQRLANSPLARRADARIPVSVQDTVVMTNVFPGASPVIALVSNGKLLMWEYQDPAKPTLQSTDIAWSFNDGSTWSAAVVIASDTRAEFSPSVVVDGNGRAVAVWDRISGPSFSTPINGLADLPLFYRRFELVSSVFDPATRTWSPIVQLTNDSSYDGDMILSTAPDQDVMLTWLSNAGGEFTSTASNPSSLLYSRWDKTNQTWSAPAVLASGLMGVSSHVAAFKGTEAVVLVPRDPDPQVDNDGVIDQYTWNGATWSGPTTFAAGGVENRTPTLTYDANGVGQVVWVRGYDLVHATLSDPTPNTVRTGSGSMAFYGAQLLTNASGNTTLVWQEMVDDGPANTFARIYDPASGLWSADRRLSAEPDVAHYDFEGFYGSDGVLRATYLASQIARTTETVNDNGQLYTFANVPQRGQTDLRYFEHSLVVDLAVADGDLSVSPPFPLANDSVSVDLLVHNAGDFATGAFSIVLYVGEPSAGGVQVGTALVAAPFVAGDTRTVHFSFTLPSQSGNLVAVVDAGHQVTEITETNNTARYYLANKAPVAVVHASATNGSAPLTVQFNSTGTYDADGDSMTYRWTFGDATDNLSGAAAAHTFTLAGQYMVTLTATDSKGGVGSASVFITVGTLPVAPKPVPDGGSTPGRPMTAAKNGSAVDVLWDVTTCSTSANYNLYAGVLGDYAKITDAACDLGQTGAATVNLAGSNAWWVVAGTNGVSVGSFGRDSAGRERVFSGWGPFCTAAIKDESGVCP